MADKYTKKIARLKDKKGKAGARAEHRAQKGKMIVERAEKKAAKMRHGKGT